jgi:hypothetical protein
MLIKNRITHTKLFKNILKMDQHPIIDLIWQPQNALSLLEMLRLIRLIIRYVRAMLTNNMYDSLLLASVDLAHLVIIIDIDIAFAQNEANNIRDDVYKIARRFVNQRGNYIFFITSSRQRRLQRRRRIPIYRAANDALKAACVMQIGANIQSGMDEGINMICFGGSFINHLTNQNGINRLCINLDDFHDVPYNRNETSPLEMILFLILIKRFADTDSNMY